MRELFLLFFAITLLLQCTSDDSSTNETASETAPAQQAQPQQSGSSVDAMNWTFLTDGVFHNDMTVLVGQSTGSNPWEGHWVNFKEDGTFDYGEWDKKTHDGTWFYDNNTTVLQMNPSSDDFKSSEWRVLHKNNDMVWQGTSTFGDNATQSKWGRSQGYPQKAD